MLESAEAQMTLAPRQYQLDLIERARAEFRAGKRRVLCVAPTGSGKTLTGAYMVRGAVEQGLRVLFAAGRIELIDQTRNAFLQAGITDVRVIQGARDEGPADARVIVGSIDTIVARQLPPIQFGILDEAHHGNSRTWSALIDSQPEARWVGFTATPIRSDRKPMGDVFDALVIGPSVKQLTAAGHLVPCWAWAGPPTLRSGELALTPLEAYRRFSAGRRAAIFCRDVRHAESELAEFRSAGVPAGLITGAMPKRQRAAMLDGWRSGEILVGVSVDVVTEGFDMPELYAAILARRVRHIGRYLQIAGRVLRPAPGKTSAVLVDLSGCAHEHGQPDFEHEYSLTGEAISTVAKDLIRQCPECGSIFTAGPTQCEYCGFVFLVRSAPLPRSVDAGVSEIPAAPRREYVVSIVSKYRGVCVECKKPIGRGDPIWWATVAKKARHQRCAA